MSAADIIGVAIGAGAGSAIGVGIAYVALCTGLGMLAGFVIARLLTHPRDGAGDAR